MSIDEFLILKDEISKIYDDEYSPLENFHNLNEEYRHAYKNFASLIEVFDSNNITDLLIIEEQNIVKIYEIFHYIDQKPEKVRDLEIYFDQSEYNLIKEMFAKCKLLQMNVDIDVPYFLKILNLKLDNESFKESQAFKHYWKDIDIIYLTIIPK